MPATGARSSADTQRHPPTESEKTAVQQDAQRRAHPAGKADDPSAEQRAETSPGADHKRLIAVYPGTFDPVHNGHIDIARRAAHLVDELVVAVYATPSKHLLYSTEERVELWRATI